MSANGLNSSTCTSVNAKKRLQAFPEVLCGLPKYDRDYAQWHVAAALQIAWTNDWARYSVAGQSQIMKYCRIGVHLAQSRQAYHNRPSSIKICAHIPKQSVPLLPRWASADYRAVIQIYKQQDVHHAVIMTSCTSLLVSCGICQPVLLGLSPLYCLQESSSSYQNHLSHHAVSNGYYQVISHPLCLQCDHILLIRCGIVIEEVPTSVS